MAEERVTIYRTPSGSNATVIYEGPVRSNNGAGWLFGVVLLIAVLAVVYLMAIRDEAPAARANPIAQVATGTDAAARPVGDAAEQSIKP